MEKRMDAEERKNKMMDATMQMVAAKGLDSFSVAQTANFASINEALVYRDFGTKENLLHECYVSVNKEILENYQNVVERSFYDQETLQKQMYLHWHRYFTCLVEGGYKTLFYQQYRDSAYQMHSDKNLPADPYDIKENFRAILKRFLKNSEDVDFVSTYMIDGSVLFAKRVICHEISNSEETTAKIWQLLNGGMKGLSIEKSSE